MALIEGLLSYSQICRNLSEPDTDYVAGIKNTISAFKSLCQHTLTSTSVSDVQVCYVYIAEDEQNHAQFLTAAMSLNQ